MSRSVIASVIKSHGVGDEVEVRGADGGWYLTTVQWVGHMHREPGDAEDTERVTWLGVELVDSAAPSWPIAPGKSHNGYTHHAQYFTATKGRATFVRESEARNSAERSAAIAEAAAQPAITTFDIGMRVANIHGQGEQLGVVKFYGHLEGHIEADGDDDSDLSPDEKYVGVEYDKCVGSATAFLHHGVEIWEGARYHCELLHEADAREHLRTSKRPAAILVISSPTRGVGSVVDIAPESLASAGPAVSEAVASAQAELDLLCARASNMEARRLAEACFGEMDFDGNGTLSKKEFASAWFKGQVMDGPVLTDKFRRAGGDPGADTITKLSFVYTIVKRHAGVSSSKQMLMKKTLKTFVKQTHEIRIKRMKEVEEAQKYQFLQRKANRCDDQAKEIVLLKAQLANAVHLSTDLALEKDKVAGLQERVAAAEAEKTGLKVDHSKLQHQIEKLTAAAAVATAAAAAAPVAVAGGGATEEEKAEFEARASALEAKVDQLMSANVRAEDALEHAQADLAAAIKAKEGAEASAESLKDLVAQTQAELEKIRAQKMITQDWGPLCVSQQANTKASLTSIPLEVKSLQNRLDDLSAAMRVLVRVRPLLLDNPDWKKLGMETKKSRQYCRTAKKWQKKGRAAGLAYPWLTKEQDVRFNTARKTDEDAEDCIVADVESQAISVCTKGVVIPHGRFHPLSDVIPYGGPFQHPKARPQATNVCVWERIEPLVTSAMRRTPNNVVVFAYGGTGSGKTYTMGGYDSHDSERENRKKAEGMGQVFFNSVKCMLDEVESYSCTASARKPGVEYTLSMMMADNYKSDMSDLLCTGSDRDRLKTADVVRLGSSGDPWESFTKKRFTDFEGFWEGYKQGITLRKVESAVNDDSSRSHLCICFEVTRREVDTYGTMSRESVSKVILVDLAGSENMREVQHRIETTWVGDKPSMMKFLKEARLQTQAINKALFSLQTCIQEIAKAIKRAGANGTKLAIPRKAFPSLLTKLLATALKPCVLSPIGGVDSTEAPKASRIMMVCCIAAAGTWRDTTMASLGFASECMKIKLEDPAQIALKLPLIEMLQAKKDDLTDLQHECEVFLDEYTQEELLQLEDDEQKEWHDKALEYSKKIARAHKEVARALAAQPATATASGGAHPRAPNALSKLTHGHFGEGKHRRKTAALLTRS